MKSLRASDILLLMFVTPIVIPFSVLFVYAADTGHFNWHFLSAALAVSYTITVPIVGALVLFMPARYWHSDTEASVCEGTPGGN